jgi:lysophospholipid acyltransferase (LPLAT)-like uncharacterized protein
VRLLWSALAWPIGLGWYVYLRLVRATSRVTSEGAEPPSTAVFVNFHRHQSWLIGHHGAHGRWMMVSPAPPLAPIARFCLLAGLRLARGTSGDRGRQALEELAAALGRGESVSLAVDGPAGPVFVAKRGCVDLAQRARVPIVPIAYRCARGFTLPGRWDRTLLPMPFDRITVVHGEAIAPEGDAADVLARVQRGLEELRRTC